MEEMEEKPPLGLIPYDIWREQRMQDIRQAMGRYAGANMDIPKEWVDEYLSYRHRG